MLDFTSPSAKLTENNSLLGAENSCKLGKFPAPMSREFAENEPDLNGLARRSLDRAIFH